MSVYLSAFAHMWRCLLRPEAVDPLKLELWLIMSCLIGVLGTELGSTRKAANPFNPESSLQPQLHSVRDFCSTINKIPETDVGVQPEDKKSKAASH